MFSSLSHILLEIYNSYSFLGLESFLLADFYSLMDLLRRCKFYFLILFQVFSNFISNSNSSYCAYQKWYSADQISFCITPFMIISRSLDLRQYFPLIILLALKCNVRQHLSYTLFHLISLRSTIGKPHCVNDHHICKCDYEFKAKFFKLVMNSKQ